MQIRHTLVAGTTAIALFAIGTAAAIAHPRGPIISCNARGAVPSGASDAYAPSECSLSSIGPGGQGYGSAATLYGFEHVKWSDWGATTATGTGISVFCDQGCRTTKVTVKASGLTHIVVGTTVAAYSQVRVSWRAQTVPIVGQQASTVYEHIPSGSTPVYDVLPLAEDA
jgi:hypothetical protein